MKAEDLRTKSADELKESLLGLRKEQFNLRFQQASGQLENTARARQFAAISRESKRSCAISSRRRLRSKRLCRVGSCKVWW